MRGAFDLPVVTPVAWPDLAAGNDPHPSTAAAFPARLAAVGDLFSTEVTCIGDQRLPAPAHAASAPPALSLDSAPRGHVILAALAILEDGKAHSADEILAAALARKLVPPQTTRKYVYTALIEYVARTLGHGRKPQLIQDGQRKFRINEPPDDWPDLVTFPQPALDVAKEALIARLTSTATGSDPQAFELACCDAFAELGFRTRHLGAHAQPDGIADAQLGPLAYRALLECKTGKRVVSQPDAAEAAKFVPAFCADFALLIGPDFTDETELIQELQTHEVTALTVADLSTLLSLPRTALSTPRCCSSTASCKAPAAPKAARAKKSSPPSRTSPTSSSPPPPGSTPSAPPSSSCRGPRARPRRAAPEGLQCR